MPSQREPPDLLEALFHERRSAGRRRRFAAWGAGATLFAAGIAEPFTHGSLYLIGGVCLALVVLVLLGIALGYSACVFLATWTFAQSMQDKGQTRPTVGQMAVIFLVCAAAALPIAAFAIHDGIDYRFWGALLVLAWNNLSCAFLGYGAAFYTRLRVRAGPSLPPIEE